MASEFEDERRKYIDRLGRSERLRDLSLNWLTEVSKEKYSYNFTWLGLPIIQFPTDIIAVQEIIWRVKPDLIVETGIARGGSMLLSASILELIGGDGQVVGIDIEIRDENRAAIESHPLSKRIQLLEGSSVDRGIVDQVVALAEKKNSVLVILDSNHTYDHVWEELACYAPCVTSGSYLIVFDTVIEKLPPDFFPDRPWGEKNNPFTAVMDFLETTDRFVIDEEFENKLLVTVAPSGYLRCVKD